MKKTELLRVKYHDQQVDVLQTKALEVLKEKQDNDAGLLLYNSGNSGGARPKAVFKDERGHWHLAPAYDLTLCTEGYNGEHATSVNGIGHPTLKDFIAVGTKAKIREQRCREIIDEEMNNCSDLVRYTIV